MTTIAIVTCTETGGIGIENRFPWPKFFFEEETFNEVAKDRVVLVGRGAFSQHEYLRGDVTYVLTSNENFGSSDIIKSISGEPADVIAQIQEENPGKDIVIAGGESLFRAYDELIDEWYLTIVEEVHIFDREILLARIKLSHPNHKFVTSGVDHNQNFSRWHYTK